MDTSFVRSSVRLFVCSDGDWRIFTAGESMQSPYIDWLFAEAGVWLLL